MLTRFRRVDDEQGSVLLAMLIVTVAILALMTVSGSVVTGLNNARTDQNRINAFQHANAGIDLALERIDRQNFTGVTFTSTSLGYGFTDSVTLDNAKFDVDAREVTAGQSSTWTVRSTGTDLLSGRKRLAIATVSTARLFQDAFFTVTGFTLTGNQGTPMSYDSATDPTAAHAVSPVPATLGTNGTISGSGISHFSDLWAGFVMYGRATQSAADGDCQGCGTAPKVIPVANQLNKVPPDPPGVVSPCPSGGNVSGGVIQPGDYLCSQLTLNGTVTIGSGGNGTGRVRIWVQGPFDASGVVNRNGRPNNFQIFQHAQANGSPYANHDICDSDLWMLLFTPGLRIDCVGAHQPTLHGAVIADFYSGAGNHFNFFYDVQASTVLRDSKYQITNWHECPAGSTDC